LMCEMGPAGRRKKRRRRPHVREGPAAVPEMMNWCSVDRRKRKIT
jgi:hypothetical protein